MNLSEVFSYRDLQSASGLEVRAVSRRYQCHTVTESCHLVSLVPDAVKNRGDWESHVEGPRFEAKNTDSSCRNVMMPLSQVSRNGSICTGGRFTSFIYEFGIEKTHRALIKRDLLSSEYLRFIYHLLKEYCYITITDPPRVLSLVDLVS
ncbi:hypothetical protein Plhal304r1_c077g0164191 [Plasmopara halstedii]